MNELKIEYIYLNVRFKISQQDYDNLRFIVEEHIKSLVGDCIYSAKNLCGNVLWFELCNTNKRIMGMAIAHMVDKGELPLKCIKMRHEYPCYYALK